MSILVQRLFNSNYNDEFKSDAIFFQPRFSEVQNQ
jgi:hypothetical protein